MYWIWANEAQDERDASIHGQPEVIRKLDLDFGLGVRQRLNVPVIEIHMKAEHQGRLTDNLIAPGTTGLVFNAKLRNLLEQTGVDNIDYYKAKVINDVTGEVISDYQVANIIGRAQCIDRNRSKLIIDERGGSIMFIDKLVLDESAVGEAMMVRLLEFLPIIIVHERIKKQVVAAEISGVKFYRPEEYIL